MRATIWGLPVLLLVGVFGALLPVAYLVFIRNPDASDDTLTVAYLFFIGVVMTMIAVTAYAITRRVFERDLFEALAVTGQHLGRTRPYSSNEADKTEEKRGRFLATRRRILRYLNTRALLDLTTSSEPYLISERLRATKGSKLKVGIRAKLPFIGSHIDGEDENSVEQETERRRTEPLEYAELERSLLQRDEVRLTLEDFDPASLETRMSDLDEALQKLTEAGANIPTDVLSDIKQQRYAEAAERFVGDLRTGLPFLMLMEGEFDIQMGANDTTIHLYFKHPISDHVPNRSLGFTLACSPEYLKQTAAFPTSPIHLTVLGQATAVEEFSELESDESTVKPDPRHFVLHILPIAIY